MVDRSWRFYRSHSSHSSYRTNETLAKPRAPITLYPWQVPAYSPANNGVFPPSLGDRHALARASSAHALNHSAARL